MKKLSLIVPIYGVERYIYKFLDTLEKNLKPNIEVLMIDDGTKDNSGKIVDEFALKHQDIVKVVHKENGGVSSARNIGLRLAIGEYVIFPDPDDYLADNYIETILNAIEEYNNPDMVFFDFYEGTCEADFKIMNVPGLMSGVVAKEVFIKEFIKDTYIKGMLWHKAIKRNFYKGLEFNTKTKVAEDYELLTDLVLRLESIVYVKKPLYFYIQRANSLTYNQKVEDGLRFYDLIADRQKKYSLYYKHLSIYKLVKFSHGMIMRKYLCDELYDIKKFELTIKENIFSTLFSSEFSLNEKKQCIFICLGLADFYYRNKYKNKGR